MTVQLSVYLYINVARKRNSHSNVPAYVQTAENSNSKAPEHSSCHKMRAKHSNDNI